MSQHNGERPRINGLAIRRVTRYAALLLKEWEANGKPELAPRESVRVREPYRAPSIPDPWDIERAEREPAAPEFSIPRTLPEEPKQTVVSQGPDADKLKEHSPWQDEPLTVAHSHAGTASERPGDTHTMQTPDESADDGLFWSISASDAEGESAPLPWELPDDSHEDGEGAVRAPTFANPQDQDDFARAMMYLSSDDDFLVTGVGKRSGPARAQSEALPRPEANPPVVAPPKETSPEPVSRREGVVDKPQVRERKPIDQARARQAALREPRRPLFVGRIALIALIILALSAAGIAVWYFFFREKVPSVPGAAHASAVYIGGESLGCVADGPALQKLLEDERLRVENEAALPAVLTKTIRIEDRLVDTRFLAPQKEMELAVLNACEVMVEASGVYVDGRLVAIARSEDEVREVMEGALAPFRLLAQNNRDIQELRFSESVEVKPMTTSPQNVLDVNALASVLISGESAAQQTYEVVAGDSLIAIAGNNDLKLGQLRYANPNLIGKDLIQVGQTLSLTPPKGLLTVQFTERVTEETKLPFDTETKTSSSMYTTEVKTEVKGQDGLRKVVADKVYIAGVLAHENILEETVLKEPVTQVIVKGTKKVTAASGSGTYVWPAQGKISSTFKMRWGRQHQGLDIAANTGTPIYAARAGTVTFSGTNGDYGKMIKIDHGGGVETRYAHCSALKVSSGTTVKKGQLIALVGSTGNSTGPHLHFEIRINGVAKDPQNYLPK